jgi:NAD+ synthase (glutamine-hydrolysing)
MQRNPNLRIALAQINTTVGDLQGNADKILYHVEQAKAAACQLICFPELTITGYPPEDLLLRDSFIHDQLKAVDALAAQIDGISVILGYVDTDNGQLYNSAAVIQNKKIRARYHKIQLPNYSVFDEQRYFKAGSSPLIVELDGILIGISICEDIWIPQAVTESQALIGNAEILLNISASPYALDKRAERKALMQERAKKNCSIVIYNNLIGGQDELVFDGQSMIVDPTGEIIAQGAAFAEDFIVKDINVERVRELRKEPAYQFHVNNFCSPFAACTIKNLKQSKKTMFDLKFSENKIKQPASLEEEIYNALILGVRDYGLKNGFNQVVFGLSGGIDSALVAVIAADALGPQNVNCFTMPSQFSSKGSVDDSELLAENLGININVIGIRGIFENYIAEFKHLFAGFPSDVTEENLQARIRGNIVMALSNKFGWLPLATGNKSEISVGYCTIYGDMVGGFAPLKDVTKTMVYRLSEYRNQRAGTDVIPRAIIDKPPSAELRPDQKDQDSLPPYDELDQMLEMYIEKRLGVEEIIAAGFTEETTKKIAHLVDLNEYKRRQAAPGVKITPLAFGKDRRMPITNLYK